MNPGTLLANINGQLGVDFLLVEKMPVIAIDRQVMF